MSDADATDRLTEVANRFKVRNLEGEYDPETGTGKAQCPRCKNHHFVEFHFDEDDPNYIAIEPCDNGCLPEDVIKLLAIDETLAEWVKAPGWFERFEQTTRAHLPHVLSSGEKVNTDASAFLRLVGIFEARGYNEGRGYRGNKPEGRYRCPSCDARGDGHGVKIEMGKDQPVVLFCHSCKISCDKILTELDLTWDDISKPLYDGDEELPDPSWLRRGSKNGKVDKSSLEGDENSVEDDEDFLAELLSVNDIGSPVEPEFFWGDEERDRIEASNLALIVGDSNVGKGLMSAWLMAELSKGTLPGCHLGNPTGCIFISSEESYEKHTRPRLDLLKADLDKVRFFNYEDYGVNFTFTNPKEAEMDRRFKAWRAAGYRLVIIDPIGDFAKKGFNSNSKDDVRGFLVLIQKLAQKHGITVIGLLHTNKILDDFRRMIQGSSAWRAVPRSVTFIVRDPENPYVRHFFVEKLNNGRETTDGESFEVQAEDYPGFKRKVPRLSWLADVVAPSKEAWVTETQAKNNGKGKSKTGKGDKEERQKVLSEYLSFHGGEMSGKDCVAFLMERFGISRATAYRVPEGSFISTGKTGDADAVWSLKHRVGVRVEDDE